MKVETYLNGQLIEIKEIDNVVLLPNFTEFIARMLSADSYAKLIKNSTNQQAKNRLELAAVRLELKPEISNQDIETFKFIWDNLIADIPISIIDPSNLIELKQIAKFANMPFTFGLDFKIELE